VGNKRFKVYWDFLGAHKPYSGLYTHMLSLKEALNTKGLHPDLVGEKSSFYRMLLSFPFSKITCPHYSSLLLRPVGKTVFHSFANLNTSFLFPENPSVKRVLTVHDIIPLLAKEKTSYLSHFQFKLFLGRALSSSHKILCVSSWTRCVLEKLYPQFESKYEVIPNGVSKKVETFSLPFKKKKNELHVLCVSRFEHYKRFELAVELVEACQDLKLSFVTNEKGRVFLEEMSQKKGVFQRVFIYEGLSQEALNNIFQRCDVFLNTSLYEGFCLPAYEALRFLKPVVYQKGHALDELGNKAAIGVDTASSALDWLEGIKKGKELSQGPNFEASVTKLFNSFMSWDEVAGKVEQLYEEL